MPLERRTGAAQREVPNMARRRRVQKASPKTPARARKRTPAKKKRAPIAAHHRPELIGLALIAIGIFLAAVLWFGLSGGPVTHLVRSAVGDAAYLAPLVLIPLGVLVVARSALVAVSPFRLGLGAGLLGLMLTLGRGHGGAVGRAAERVVALGLGTTGATILGVLLTVAGVLFLTGASLGAILRRSGHAMQAAHRRVRENRLPAVEEYSEPSHVPTLRAVAPPVDLAARLSRPHLLAGRGALPAGARGDRAREQRGSDPGDAVPQAGAERRRVQASGSSPAARLEARLRAECGGGCQGRRCRWSPAWRTSASTQPSSARSPARASRATSCNSRRARRSPRSRS